MAIAHGMFDPGNVSISAPYYISGKTGALTVPAAAAAIATLQNLGRVDPNGPTGAALIPVPLRISQASMRFLLTSGATATVGFEVYKGAVTVQHNAGGVARTAARRKTSGYPAITAAEVNLFIATTGAITGGTFVADGDPLDMVGCGSAATFGFGASDWQPLDLCGVSLEAGEGLEVRVTQQAAAVGIFMVRFDFLRQ